MTSHIILCNESICSKFIKFILRPNIWHTSSIEIPFSKLTHMVLKSKNKKA